MYVNNSFIEIKTNNKYNKRREEKESTNTRSRQIIIITTVSDSPIKHQVAY